MIHLYYKLNFSKNNSVLTIVYNTRVWSQQCRKCLCFGDKSITLANLDKIAKFFGKRLLEKASVIIPNPEYDDSNED